MPPTAVVAQLSIPPLMGIKFYAFGFDVPVIHVGMLVGEVSLQARLDAPLVHKRLVFLHIPSRTSMTCTYVVPALPGLVVMVGICRIQCVATVNGMST
jgi:hypothetical protein